jgi:hypothetical protein
VTLVQFKDWKARMKVVCQGIYDLDIDRFDPSTSKNVPQWADRAFRDLHHDLTFKSRSAKALQYKALPEYSRWTALNTNVVGFYLFDSEYISWALNAADAALKEAMVSATFLEKFPSGLTTAALNSVQLAYRATQEILADYHALENGGQWQSSSQRFFGLLENLNTRQVDSTSEEFREVLKTAHREPKAGGVRSRDQVEAASTVVPVHNRTVTSIEDIEKALGKDDPLVRIVGAQNTLRKVLNGLIDSRQTHSVHDTQQARHSVTEAMTIINEFQDSHDKLGLTTQYRICTIFKGWIDTRITQLSPALPVGVAAPDSDDDRPARRPKQ